MMELMRLMLLATLAAAACGFGAARGHDAVVARRSARRLLQIREEVAAPGSADLNVGTEAGKANVVSGFEVVGTWTSGDDLASIVPPTDRVTNFYLRATGGSLQLTRAAVTPDKLPHLVTSLDGPLAKELGQQGQVNLQADKERRLSVVYDCRSTGDAALSLTLEFEGLSSVQIPFKKTCGGDRNTALTVTVGSASDGEKVVVMGTPKWDELKVVGVRPASSVFTVFVDPLSEKGAQVVSTPRATGIGACSAQASAVDPSRFPGGKANLAAGEGVDIAVDYRCFRHGNCIVSVQVPFFPDMAPYQPLRWSWTKLCGGEALGIDIEVEGGKKNKKEGRRLLATDGAANTSMATSWIVEDGVTEHKVRLVNDKKRSLEQEVKVRALTVRCLDATRCSTRFVESTPTLLKADSPLDLNVEYDCHSTGSSLVQLVLATEGHDPVVATWAKDCSSMSDSFVGVCLFMICTGMCLACACVGFAQLCFGQASGSLPGRGKLMVDGEFLEDENLSEEELLALSNYEDFYGLQRGAAAVEQVKDSGLGVHGWAGRAPMGPPQSFSEA